MDGLRGEIQRKKEKGADVWKVDILLPRWTSVGKGKLRTRKQRVKLDGLRWNKRKMEERGWRMEGDLRELAEIARVELADSH